MRPLVAIAFLWTIASLPLNLEAQVRGGPRRGGFPPRTGAFVTTGRMPTVIVGRPHFGAPRFRAGFAIQPAPFYQPFFWPAPMFAAPFYSVAPSVSVQEPQPYDSSQVNELLYQVERLTREVALLREEQQARQTRQAAPEPAPPSERTSLNTILVFRDGRQMEVQNYAIAGQTLWMFTEQSSTKISTADLDLEMTQKLNAERGIRFALPRTR